MIDWAGFRFQDPLWLWAALLGPLVVAAAWLRERNGSAIVFPGASRLKGRPAGLRVALRHAPAVVAALGLVASSLAMARPQHGTLKEQVTTRGIDIIVALDISGSMAAEDFQPLNRLTVAKQVVAEFVKRRATDRIGLVIFAVRAVQRRAGGVEITQRRPARPARGLTVGEQRLDHRLAFSIRRRGESRGADSAAGPR